MSIYLFGVWKLMTQSDGFDYELKTDGIYGPKTKAKLEALLK
ncbi:hypothetical protein [Bacillus subtilis]|nr:hypothetical protein [Bacillus subtilis]